MSYVTSHNGNFDKQLTEKEIKNIDILYRDYKRKNLNKKLKKCR